MVGIPHPMKTFIALALACLGLGLTACLGLNKIHEIQDSAVTHFHDQYNNDQAGAIWDEAHARFQGASEKEAFIAYMQVVKSKLGKVTSTANFDRRMTTAKEITTVYLIQETRFENARAKETFTLIMEGGHAILVSYNVQSKLLTVK